MRHGNARPSANTNDCAQSDPGCAGCHADQFTHCDQSTRSDSCAYSRTADHSAEFHSNHYLHNANAHHRAWTLSEYFTHRSQSADAWS